MGSYSISQRKAGLVQNKKSVGALPAAILATKWADLGPAQLRAWGEARLVNSQPMASGSAR